MTDWEKEVQGQELRPIMNWCDELFKPEFGHHADTAHITDTVPLH